MPIRAIARQLGVGRDTVRRALASEGPPRYQRPAKGSAVDAVEPQIRQLLAGWPEMPATVIAERIGWTRGMTILKERVLELRPVFTPPDPTSRTVYQPGELAQYDLWFPPADVALGAGQVSRPPVLVTVSGYSRVIAARMIPTRTGEDLLAGMWALLAGWLRGGVACRGCWCRTTRVRSGRGRPAGRS
jgi:transposase